MTPHDTRRELDTKALGLKPCPFCKGLFFDLYVRPDQVAAAVECATCGALGPESTNDEFGHKLCVKRWNSR